VHSGDDRALTWLTQDADPAVQVLARRDLLHEPVSAHGALASDVVRGLLAGQQRDGGFAVGPYTKWTGAHWRLVSLVELGIPAGHDGAVAATNTVLDYWAGESRLKRVPVIAGRARRCASQEGNAVAVACRLGLASDQRVQRLVEHLIAWQWDDGGWNCDKRASASHSSFNETLPPLWGLHEYAAATGDSSCMAARDRAAELLLRHRVAFSTRTGEPIHPSVVELHYPPFWHYDLLQALVILTRAGFGADPRMRPAREIVVERRRPDGTWQAGRRWWRPPGSAGSNVEAVDWDGVAHQLVTLNALRVGASADRPITVSASGR
jgi:hypothetical protein